MGYFLHVNFDAAVHYRVLEGDAMLNNLPYFIFTPLDSHFSGTDSGFCTILVS